MKRIFRRIIFFAAAVLPLLAFALNRDGRVLARAPGEAGAETVEKRLEWTDADGSRVVSTEELAKDVQGFAGETPLLIYIKNGRVSRVDALDNYETPPFFEQVEREILPAWNGLTPDEALAKNVDAVSGATITSQGVIETFRRGMEYVRGVEAARRAALPGAPQIAAFAAALCGLVLPLFVKSPVYRRVQLAANVVVLGFYAGTFVSYSLLLNLAANGVRTWNAALALPLIFAALVMPLLGKKNYYCAWMCPLGSFQELLSRAPVPKLKISAAAAKRLGYFREGVWLVMMALMWLGVGFELINYELFTAFLFRHAVLPVLVLAGVFLALSLFVPRPYCRFFCPTGTLLKFAQGDCACASVPRLGGLLAAAFVAAPLWILARAFF